MKMLFLSTLLFVLPFVHQCRLGQKIEGSRYICQLLITLTNWLLFMKTIKHHAIRGHPQQSVQRPYTIDGSQPVYCLKIIHYI
jgi:hypothetical protein